LLAAAFMLIEHSDAFENALASWAPKIWVQRHLLEYQVRPQILMPWIQWAITQSVAFVGTHVLISISARVDTLLNALIADVVLAQIRHPHVLLWVVANLTAQVRREKFAWSEYHQMPQFL
jgi:hypothetical protein